MPVAALPFQLLCAFLHLCDLLCIVPVCDAQRHCTLNSDIVDALIGFRFQQEDRPLIVFIHLHTRAHTYIHSLNSFISFLHDSGQAQPND